MVLIPRDEARQARERAIDDARLRFKAAERQASRSFTPQPAPAPMQGREVTRRAFDVSPNPEAAARGPFVEQPRVNFRVTQPPERTVTERGGGLVDVDLSRYGGGQFANLSDVREVAPGSGIRGTGVTGIERLLDLDNIDRPRGAFFGSIAAMEDEPVFRAPFAAVRGAVEGFQNPRDFQGRDSSIGRQFSDEDVIGSFSPRDLVGGALDIGLDPIDLATGGTLGTDAVRLGARGVRALSDDAAETAIRAAEGPLEASGRGVLRPAKLRPPEEMPLEEVKRNLAAAGHDLRPNGGGQWILPDGTGVGPTNRRGIVNHWEAAVDSRLLPEDALEFPGNPIGITNALEERGWLRWRGGHHYEAWKLDKNTARLIEDQILANPRLNPSTQINVDLPGENRFLTFTLGEFADADFSLRRVAPRAQRQASGIAAETRPSNLGIHPPPPSPGAVDPVIPGVTPRGRASLSGASLTPDELAASESALPALRDALQAEVSLRRSGVVADEIREGRALQAGRAGSNIAAARSAGGGLDEMLQAGRQGLRTGQLRRTFSAPLEVTRVQKDALAVRVQDALAQDGPFTQFNGLQALDKLVRGENVQPAQLKLLRRALGDDIADMARQANQGRPSAIARLDDAQRAEVERAAPFRERQIAKLEQRAVAQNRLADELTADLGMDPTNARLQQTAETARNKALEFQNRADSMLVERAQKLAGIPDDATEALAQQKATYGRVNTLRGAEEAQRAGTATPQQELVLQARDLIGRRLTVSPDTTDEMIRSLDYWLDANRAILDKIGETTWTRTANIASTMSGNLADSYLTNLFQRRAIMESALANQGWDESLARRVSQLLVDSELKARYPEGIPERIAAEIEKTKPVAYGDNAGNILRGMAAYSQEWKNLAFGPADVGVFGQQVLKAASMSPTNILAGAVNRTLSALNLPAVPTTLVDEMALSKRLQYQLDGVPQGITTGIVQDADATGTFLKHIPGIGRIDPMLSRWIEFSTDFQFRRVLGGLRNLNYEGNLVALHLTGQDITNPAVRATAAGMANAATSYAPRALDTKRALAESAAMMTPSMRRAQVTSILQLARVFSPKATAAERTLGSIAILNLAGATLGVGKLLHDVYGADGSEFIFDPSQQGFGNITTRFKNSDGENVIINLFPQQQVATTIAQSVRALQEGDTAMAAEEWAKLFIGSSGPALQIAERAAGVGYQPGEGYKFGDLNEGVGLGDRVLNMLPLPPIFQSYVNEGLTPTEDPGQFALEAAGIQNFGESGYGLKDRIARETEGKPYSELEPHERDAIDRMPEVQQSADRELEEGLERGDSYALTEQASRQRAEQQSLDDEAVRNGAMSWSEWRSNRENRNSYLRGTLDTIFAGSEDKRDPSDPLRQFSDQIEANEQPNGTVDWDRVFAWVDGQPEETQAYIERNTGLNRTPLEKERAAVAGELEDNLYFDIRPRVWQRIAEREGIEIDDPYEFQDQLRTRIRERLVERGQTDPATLRILTDKVMEEIPQIKAWTEVSNTVEQAWIEAYPDLANRAFALGYLGESLRGDEERAIIAAGQ